MIQGVEIKNLRVIPDERGRLMEILRCDEKLFKKFGQVYVSTTYPGVVKAWHLHEEQFDNIVCLYGMIKLVLYDSRKNSPTFNELNEFFLGNYNPQLVQIPPNVFHGWKCIGEEEAIVMNIPTEPYKYDNPDEIRIDPHKNDIPYDWSRKDG
ncbi:MAG: dTDP-4-dehydrorhamnose 3,5-epimerase family protein [Acidobacteriota bacterium]